MGEKAMICPYWTRRSAETIQTRREYDDDGRESFCETVDSKVWEPMECAENGCACWNVGGCGYKGAVN